MNTLVMFDQHVCEVIGMDSGEMVAKVRAIAGAPFDGESMAFVDFDLLILPSFFAQHGRSPIMGKDFDGNEISEDDYEYLTGTGHYSDYVRAVTGLVGNPVKRAPVGGRNMATATPGERG